MFILIGLSLGAHASGTAGFYINQRKNGMIGRITGLDPAGKILQFISKLIQFLSM